MTTRAAFSPDEWHLVLEGPPSAGLLVITASHGGTFRETFAMSKAYAEARAQHGESELLDEIVGEKPRMERGKVHNPEELRDQAINCLTDATTLLGLGDSGLRARVFGSLTGNSDGGGRGRGAGTGDGRALVP